MPPSPVCLAFSTLYHRFAILSRTFFDFLESGAFQVQSSKALRVTVHHAMWPSPSRPCLTVPGLYHRFRVLSRRIFDSSEFLTLCTGRGSVLRFPRPVCLRYSFCIPLPVFPFCCRCRRSWPSPSGFLQRISIMQSRAYRMRLIRCILLEVNPGRVG